MMPRLAAVAAGLAAGHAVAGSLGWWLVNVPDSNAAVLFLSALLACAVVSVTGWVQVAACLTWIETGTMRQRAARSARALPVFVVAVLIFFLLWQAVGRGESWLVEMRGENDAAIMSRTGSARTAWVHVAIGWAAWFLRYVMGLSLALTLLVTGAIRGPRSLLRPSWVLRALRPLQLAITAILLLVFIVLPWQVVYWRPDSLPANWLEPAFAGLKLLAIYAAMHAGWALVLGTAACGATGSPASLFRRRAPVQRTPPPADTPFQGPQERPAG